ncbi:MAG: WecB/TagA/CpsF family glycosyltransferase [Dactylosporangium sp.]|nr:WecB/TagA/CpsF family glycosyltransferase [Dactylosporangium sp.]NNJ60397.1 WecB/TagA/CpsF family glycosyltransferase [Dactylosporangium sp.]
MRNRHRVSIGGVGFDPLGDAEFAVHVCAALAAGVGGWATVPTLDVVARAMRDPAVRSGLASADLVLASGTPLWLAARLAGARLPAPDASTFIWAVLAAARSAGRSVYLLGGEPEIPGRREGAHRAASVVSFACPGVTIVGHASPRPDADGDSGELAAICAEIGDVAPDVVVVGLDVARQAWVAARLRRALPGTWFIGWPAAIRTMTDVPERTRGRVPPVGLTARLCRGALAERRSEPAGVDPSVLGEQPQHCARGVSDG